MGVGGVGYGVRVAGRLGVVRAHQALQFGKLADHGRTEVGFGDLGGLFGLVGVGADQRGDFAGQGGDAGDAVVLAAEFVMEGDGFEAVEPLTHPGLGHRQVLLVEKFRV